MFHYVDALLGYSALILKMTRKIANYGQDYPAWATQQSIWCLLSVPRSPETENLTKV